MFSLSIEDMSCQHCVASITKAVQGLAPDARVQADVPARRVDIEGAVDEAAAIAAITEIGFTALPL